MSDCTECGWPVATDADNDRPCDDHCDHCRGLCWHEFTGVHRDDVRPDAAIATLTHRAEAADLWRERCNKAEQKVDALRAKLARAEGVVAAARAVAREHDRYLSDEVGPMGHVDEACDALRAALATYEEG